MLDGMRVDVGYSYMILLLQYLNADTSFSLNMGE
jgi:hypothetical protein